MLDHLSFAVINWKPPKLFPFLLCAGCRLVKAIARDHGKPKASNLVTTAFVLLCRHSNVMRLFALAEIASQVGGHAIENKQDRHNALSGAHFSRSE